MSQQIMTIVSILQQILAEAGDMGDTEYMAKKAFDGKAVRVTADINDVGNKLSYTVTAGKKFYFHSAKIVVTGHPNIDIATGVPVTTNTKNAVEADLIIDSVVVDTTNIGFIAASGSNAGGAFASGAGAGTMGDGKFDVKGRTAEAGEIIEIENIVDNGNATATLIGFEEDTLTDPTLLAQSITVEASVAGDTGDLVFLKERILSGNVFEVSGDIDALQPAAGSSIEFIVPNNKTAFLLDAKIIPNNTGTNNKIQAALKIDGVTKDEAEIFRHFIQQMGSTNQGGSGAGLAENTNKFNVKTLSLIGDGFKKIEIENIQDGGGAFATMSGYLVDT